MKPLTFTISFQLLIYNIIWNLIIFDYLWLWPKEVPENVEVDYHWKSIDKFRFHSSQSPESYQFVTSGQPSGSGMTRNLSLKDFQCSQAVFQGSGVRVPGIRNQTRTNLETETQPVSEVNEIHISGANNLFRTARRRWKRLFAWRPRASCRLAMWISPTKDRDFETWGLPFLYSNPRASLSFGNSHPRA